MLEKLELEMPVNGFDSQFRVTAVSSLHPSGPGDGCEKLRPSLPRFGHQQGLCGWRARENHLP